jgi:alginate O-acetyltransferase complex protein AlgI
MALGIGRMIGFHFPENFDNPYASRSITEFWRRWHMTLGFWMREYLYIPLGGNRVKSRSRLYFNLWLVFLLSGLWHGASWNFVVWGAYHGLFLVLDRMFLLKWLERLPRLLSVTFTFFVVALGWAFFRIEDFTVLGKFLLALFSFRGNWPAAVLDPEVITTFLLAALFAFFILLPGGKAIQRKVYYPAGFFRRRLPVLLGAVVLFVVSLSFITTSGFNPFIYFRF